MAFEYDGKIYLNLEEQVEVNSRMAVDAKETAEAATEAVSGKMDKVPSAFTGGIPTINMDGSLTNSNRSFTTQYGTARQEGQVVYSHALIPTEKATVDFLNDNYTKSTDITAALAGKVDKQTTTSSSPRAYVYSSDGDSYLPVIRADNTALSIVQRTSQGQIVTAETPLTDRHATSKKYVDDNFAPKATNGYVEKQTTTSGSWRAYVYNNSGDNSLLVMSGGDGTVAPTGTGIAATTGGKLRTNTPTGPYHATNKQYVDDLIASAVVDFNGSTIDTPTTDIGLKVYAAMQAFGFFVPKHTGDGTIFARPLTNSEVTIPANSFAFSIVQVTSTGMKDSYINTGLYCTVDNTGAIRLET